MNGNPVTGEQQRLIDLLAASIASAQELNGLNDVVRQVDRILKNPKRGRDRLPPCIETAVALFAMVLAREPDAIAALSDRLRFIEHAFVIIPKAEDVEPVTPSKPLPQDVTRVPDDIHHAGASVGNLFADAPMPPPDLPHSNPDSPFHKYWLEDQTNGFMPGDKNAITV